MLQLEHISCGPATRPILDRIDLSVASGTICTLLGPSGSGKTTILRLIMGLAVPTTGRCSFDGTLLAADGRQLVDPERRPFSFLFQSFTLFPHLDVRRNILIGMADLDRDERRSRLDAAAGLLGIGNLLDREIHHLSGGEQQRVALARTLARRPKLLLLDEPFSNLDKMTRWQLYGEVKRFIRSAGMTAILATHDQEEAYFFSDRMAVLSAGRIVADAAPEDIYRNPGTAWLARFTGEANILSGAELHAAFPGWQPRAGSWLLRPEQIRPEPLAEGAAADGVVTNLAFTGRSTGIVVRTTAGIVLRASVPGAHGCRIGGPVRLALIEPPAELRG